MVSSDNLVTHLRKLSQTLDILEALEACPDVTVGGVVEMIHARQRELEQEPECD